MENYQVIRPIGKGSFGRVYLVKHKHDRLPYCMKTIKLEGIPPAERKACQMEVKLMEKMMHPNIVGFKESFMARGGKLLCIVMTYCDGGDLAARLKQQVGKRPFKEDQVLHWFVQLALGLHYMHEMGDNCILHRDLKTQNVFLLGNGRLVIGDLGISKALDDSTDFTKTTIGTPYYMSPEVYKSRPYNHKSDIWALGCVLYEMTTLKHAFNANSLNGLMGKVIKGRYDPIPKVYSKGLVNLLRRMLSLDPAARPSLSEILQAPLVRRQLSRLLDEAATRPAAKIGNGTMVLRHVALGSRPNQNPESVRAKQANNLIRQLGHLGLARPSGPTLDENEDIESCRRQLSPSSQPHSSTNERRVKAPASSIYNKRRQSPVRVQNESENRRINNRVVAVVPACASENSKPGPLKPYAGAKLLRLAAREHKSNLLLEKERKRAVESALGKLRQERQLRMEERRLRRDRQRKCEANAALVTESRKRVESARVKAREARVQRVSRSPEHRELKHQSIWRQDLKPAPQRREIVSPSIIAMRKAQQFERQFIEKQKQRNGVPPSPSFEVRGSPVSLHSPNRNSGSSSPPPPPPPPLPIPSPSRISQRKSVHVSRQRKSCDAEAVRREVLLQAAQDRLQELRIVSDKYQEDFNTPTETAVSRVEAEAEAVPDADGSENRKPEIGLGLQVELDQDSEDEHENDLLLSDHSSLPDLMEVASDDDDIDKQEEELVQELRDASIRYSTLKTSLRRVQAELKHTTTRKRRGAPQAPKTQSNQNRANALKIDAPSSPVSMQKCHDGSTEQATSACQKWKKNHANTKHKPNKIQKSEMPLNVTSSGYSSSSSSSSSSNSSSSSSSSEDDALFSPIPETQDDTGFAVSHRGGLKSRAQHLEDECIRALGRKRFDQVYALLKNNLEFKLRGDGSLGDKRVETKVRALLASDGKLAFWNKVDNLIFMQEAI